MKKIKVSEEYLTTFLEQIKASLQGKKVIPEKMTYETNPSIKLKDDEKIAIIFEDDARKKMLELVRQAKDEIGWHGTVERKGEKEFVIKDIFVFPQTVTGATVTTNEEEYLNFIMQLTDEEINNMRLYGHSHVNMPVSPSSTDDVYQENLMQNVQDYYIFGIFNKSGGAWWNVYDVEKNILYEDKDIKYQYYVSEHEEWAEEQIKQCVKKAPVNIKNYNCSYNNPSAKGNKVNSDNYWKGNYDREDYLDGYNAPGYYYD